MTEYDGNGGDWAKHRLMIMAEQKRCGEQISEVTKKLDKLIFDDMGGIKTDIELLKFKAAMWGTVGGSVFGAIVAALIKTWIK